MVKHVVEKRMVAHLWANQSQDSAHTANYSFSFEGRTLYSYRTAIGHLHMGANGREYALLTSRKYSPTTSSQVCLAADALIHGRLFFVSDPLAVAAGHAELVTMARERIAAYAKVRMGSCMARLDNDGDAWGHSVALGAIFDATNYAEAFGLPDVDLTDELDAARAAFTERLAKYEAQPKVQARRDAAERHEREAAQRREAQRAADHARAAATRAAWLDGANLYYHGTTLQGGAYMRVKDNTLETSLGAKVPLADAVKVFRLVRAMKEAGKSWHRNGEALKVGDFQVDHIAPDGTMRAGCHLMFWPEIEAVARQAGVYP